MPLQLPRVVANIPGKAVPRPCHISCRNSWRTGSCSGIINTEGVLTVRRPLVKFHSTARMYMDQSLPGTESVFCFWPVLNPAPQCNFPMASENFIVEPFHGQEFSTNAHSQTWNFPLVLYINGIFRWCSFH